MTSAAPVPDVAAVVGGLLAAVESRDLDRIGSYLTTDATWANVPHPPAVGRGAVCAMLASVVGRAERVRWDVVSAAYGPDRAHLERLDRFWIDGREVVAPCHGVFCVDLDRGQVREVRDYVDLAPWRAALAGSPAEGTRRAAAPESDQDVQLRRGGGR